MMGKNSSPRDPLDYALGIDAGCASVGWAVVKLNKQGDPVSLHSAGVRRFDAGVEGDIVRGKDESLSQQRREARGPRRNSWRRQWRLRKVFRLLQRAGLLPSTESDDHDTRHSLFLALDKHLVNELNLVHDRVDAQLVPYTLRARALSDPLPPHALGRALYHLSQRRGFLSNLKAGRRDPEERGKVKKGISELEHAIDAADAETLGAYFASLDPEETRIRQRWTSRQMYVDEFEKIWQFQGPHHEVLTDDFGAQLKNAIFVQRPLKSQRGLVGRCELEPYKRRAPMACLVFQRFRLLQRLNDLVVYCPDGEVRPLLDEEKGLVLSALTAQGDMTWPGVKKLLRLKKSKTYGRNYEFNFEQGGDKKLVGNRTSAKFATVLGDTWSQLSDAEQVALVDDVLAYEDEKKLVAHLQRRWNLEKDEALTVSELYLEPGYGSHSRRAIRKLLSDMEQGMPYSTARKKHYPESFQPSKPEEFLPPFNKVAPMVRNPTVSRTMAELRKVVNALIAQHGKPRLIRIELSRDLKRSRKNRKKLSDLRDANTKARDLAREKILTERGEKYATPYNILKLRLAEECNWQCPYTERSIEMDTLVGDSPQFDVEHIIPFSLSLDKSYANKTLCYHEENRHVKKNRTPFQTYGESARWEDILGRVRHFKGDAARRKLQLFQTEKLPDAEEFTNRQLSDNRYLSLAAADYLGTLYGGRVNSDGKLCVQPSPGHITAFLRRAWDLNRIVGDPDDLQQKNRADHRHHAIDAFLVAVTTPKIVKALNEAAARAESLYTRDLLVDLEPPWKGFSWKQVAGAIGEIIVSSRVNRKLNGRLHEATILSKPYEIADPKTGKPKTVHHVRKPLDKMSRGEVKAIVDPVVRAAVITKLDAIGGEPRKAFTDKNNHPYLTAQDGRLIPIHAARIRKSDTAISVGKGSKHRYFASGDNHHMEIVAVLDKKGIHKKWEGHIVSRFVGMQRYAAGKEIICHDHGQGRKFVFSLTNGEHVLVPDENGNKNLLRVMVISGDDIEFASHNDARPAKIKGKRIPGARRSYSANSLFKAGGRKVSVDPLGRIQTARD